MFGFLNQNADFIDNLFKRRLKDRQFINSKDRYLQDLMYGNQRNTMLAQHGLENQQADVNRAMKNVDLYRNILQRANDLNLSRENIAQQNIAFLLGSAFDLGSDIYQGYQTAKEQKSFNDYVDWLLG